MQSANQVRTLVRWNLTMDLSADGTGPGSYRQDVALLRKLADY